MVYCVTCAKQLYWRHEWPDASLVHRGHEVVVDAPTDEEDAE